MEDNNCGGIQYGVPYINNTYSTPYIHNLQSCIHLVLDGEEGVWGDMRGNMHHQHHQHHLPPPANEDGGRQGWAALAVAGQIGLRAAAASECKATPARHIWSGGANRNPLLSANHSQHALGPAVCQHTIVAIAVLPGGGGWMEPVLRGNWSCPLPVIICLL